ncbi:copper resistance protein B [Sphingorhabdus sp. YGSMI21]|uniref:copper resistance protein B n=1 Tax=Sphingorhabdus sp. YGSMI21 TaxID=2077182 RepID=UPI000C1E16AD|nr:copper resistance protein B [Sphingorhabdus sp. YGSMI21]ATW05788.1 copper resistance protein CopB [Sphingorhabdus sp. YGSMI21]
MKRMMVLLLLGFSQPAFAQTMDPNMKMPIPAKPAAKPKPQAKPAPISAKKTAPPIKKSPVKAPPKPTAPTSMQMGPVSIKDAPPENIGETMDHSGMDHGNMATPADQMEAMDHSGMDGMSMDDGTSPPDEMDHSSMDMSGGDTEGMDMAMPMADEPPPPEAGSGPARAAEAIWGVDIMRASREQLAKENGGMTTLWVMADRAEYRVRDGKNGYLWDGQGYYGGDIDKFWFKSEGEGNFGEKIESAEVQALWSHAIAPFFDLQAGVRQDFAPRDRTYAVIGIQGLAPYLFEIDGAAFLSDRGDLTARIEAEYEQRITQRLILQPRAELNLAAQDVPELGIGAGLDTAEMGIRLRYEFAREFAPYIGVEQEWKVGQSARYARAAGEDPSVTNYVIGMRFWF